MLEVVPLAALLVLLVTAYRRPSAPTELAVSVGCVVAALAVGQVGEHAVTQEVRRLLPVVAFLVTILVVAEVCARAGVFRAAAVVVRRGSGGSPGRLLLGVFALAAVVTAVLSLDATVVLLTPVVVGAAVALGTDRRPGAYACLRMANSSSLILPVSNLTNLLALSSLHLSFVGFARAMAPVWVVVLLVEYAALRLLFRRSIAAPATPVAVPPPAAGDHVGVPLVVVALMLVGFAVTSGLGVQPWVTSTLAAVVLVAWGVHARVVTLGHAVRSAQPSFAVFVLALGVVVVAISAGFVGDAVADLVPSSTSYVSILAIVVLATVLANLLTNLSATLLLVPLVAPLGNEAVLAALLGLNIGSGLTLTGSLANLLWQRGLAAYDDPPGLLAFHRVSLVATPVVLLAAATTLALTS